jgi:hypothetical protein
MQHFVDAVRQSLASSNWICALTTSLALPDICGWIETPEAKSQKRYEAWFDAYMLDRYTHVIGNPPTTHVFLSGPDCYALRCSLLHEGSDSTERQRAKQALTKFRFVSPKPGSMRHCNQSGSGLQLQVDVFCKDICEGVEAWAAKVLVPGSAAHNRMNELLAIESPDGPFVL